MLRDAESTYIEQILYTCINEYLYLCNIYAIYIYEGVYIQIFISCVLVFQKSRGQPDCFQQPDTYIIVGSMRHAAGLALWICAAGAAVDLVLFCRFFFQFRCHKTADLDRTQWLSLLCASDFAASTTCATKLLLGKGQRWDFVDPSSD